MEPRETPPPPVAKAVGAATAELQPSKSRPAGRVGGRQEALAGYAFVSIPMLLFLFLSIGVFFLAAYISLWDWNIRSGPEKFLGLDNYATILRAPLFLTAIKNTLFYAI